MQQQQEFGATPQEALSALLQRLPPDTPAPIVIWPFNRGDAFWTDAQQTRLQDLKSRHDALSPAERSEIEELIASSFEATLARTQTVPSVKS